MSSTAYDWDRIVEIIMYATPNFLCWCFAMFFCLTRRRENPRGATFLGLAVLISFFTHLVWYAWPYVIDVMGFSGFYAGSSIQYFLIGFHAVTTIAFWIVMVSAVFARPVHYDYGRHPVFDEEAGGS